MVSVMRFSKSKSAGVSASKLSHADAAPVEHLKGVIGQRLVHHRISEFQILFFCPVHHLPIFLFAHAASLFTGVFPENCRYRTAWLKMALSWVMHRFQIDRRIGFPLSIPVIDHGVLPGDDLLSGDIAHLELTEVGNKLGADDMFLGFPCVAFEANLHVCRILLHKALKRHLQIGGGPMKLLSLPCRRLPLGFETSLLRLLFRARPVRIAVDDTPCPAFFLFIYGPL